MRAILTICFYFLIWQITGQPEAAYWYFGNNAGISFSSGLPVALLNGALSTREGCASISSSSGELLFYTDGQTIWNKNHQIMSNGTGLLGNASSTQSAVIVPLPNSETTYYIFTVPQALDYDGLRYSIVDITQSGGLGAVTLKNISLVEPVVEKVTAVRHSNSQDIWVITHGRNNNTFYSFLVNAYGIINQPVITSAGTPHMAPTSNYVGYMKSSPDGNKIALAIHGTLNLFELFDFNRSDGTLSNPITFENYNFPYGIEFSPDGSKLYLGKMKSPPTIYQVNLNAGSPTAIINSATPIGSASSDIGALQLSPDGKIYITYDYFGYLGVINYPNETGALCSYSQNGAFLAGRLGRLGLPTFIQSYFLPVGAYSNSPVCEGETLSLYASATGATSYSWTGPNGFYSTQQNPIINNSTPSQSGTYNVTAYFGSTGNTSAQIEVTVNANPLINLGNDTTVCQGETILLSPGGSYQSYSWNTGALSPQIEVINAGLYSVFITDINGCQGYSQIQIFYSPKPGQAQIKHD
jgi:hypothetical protein